MAITDCSSLICAGQEWNKRVSEVFKRAVDRVRLLRDAADRKDKFIIG